VTPIVDPRDGDVEDDASSTKSRSLLSLAGALLAEISLPKLLAAWVLLIVVPSLLLGVAPVVVSIWLAEVSGTVSAFQIEIWSLAILAALAALALFSSKRLFRLAEGSFWALNALAVQPCYAAFREALRHLVESRAARKSASLSGLRAASALLSGSLICGLALAAIVLVWPATRLIADAAILHEPRLLARVALANSVALVSAYVAVAALVWSVADATMDQPHDLEAFDPEPPEGARWRVAHLSDIHVVGERYGFRIESGRIGPRGNERLKQAFDRLAALHAEQPLDLILITGDVTDAGLSAEWAAFFDLLASYPALAPLVLVAPGNHDLNIVDRANPARLDLPTSPYKTLRKLRLLSALDVIQGERVLVAAGAKPGQTLAAALAPLRDRIAHFADQARPFYPRELLDFWNGVFPMVRPPARPDGLGVILLNSNADTHFSFTNALGMISVEQARMMEKACAAYPDAFWLIGLHHHLVEYPHPAKALSERIGTALVNGAWFVRQLAPLAGRAVVMHGHRHVDWVGECAGLRIVSAPSPVMDSQGADPNCFYIHRLAAGADRRLQLLQPERIVIDGA
jgi:hypothetical protein